MSRIVFFEFAGREANMEVQRPHVTALLDAYPDSVFLLWDLTRKASDAAYIREWARADSRVSVMGNLHPGHPIKCRGPRRRGFPPCYCIVHKPPYEQVYREFVAFPDGFSDDDVFVKFDDDVIWMDTDRFGEVLSFLETHPNAVASANVANNAVCAKYEPSLHAHVREQFDIGGRLPTYDKDWWSLHTSAAFAELSLGWLAANLPPNRNDGGIGSQPPVRTRPGETISINFIAMKYPTLRRAASMMVDGRLGDEGTIDSMLPWIIPNFRVAHLSFGPQEKGMGENGLSSIREAYSALSTKEASKA